jgi:hypothetical protein
MRLAHGFAKFSVEQRLAILREYDVGKVDSGVVGNQQI